VHAPELQLSLWLQASPSSQLEASGSFAVQSSVASSHDSEQSVSASPRLAAHGSPEELPQVPAAHNSVPLQNAPSSQLMPVSPSQMPETDAPAAMLQAWQSFESPPPQAESQQTSSTQ